MISISTFLHCLMSFLFQITTAWLLAIPHHLQQRQHPAKGLVCQLPKVLPLLLRDKAGVRILTLGL